MNFEDELSASIKQEMERFKDQLVVGGLDMRAYDRIIGGYHALRLVIEEHIPEARKKLNDR